MTTTAVLKLKGNAYENFINSLKAEKTKTEYRRSLLDYAAWRGVKSLDQLLIGSDIELKDHITKYLTRLRKNKHLSASSASVVCSALQHFYTQNDKILNWKVIRKFIGEDEIVHKDREYTYEEIAKLLSAADIKYKAIILFLCSTAVRAGALPAMKVGDLVKMKGHEIYKVIVYANTRHQYTSFTTPEAYRAINDYLDLRTRFGEKITGKSPLWRNDINPEDTEQVHNPIRLRYDAFKSKIRYLLVKTGITQPQKGRHRNEVMQMHGFRKFAYTQMARERMDSETGEKTGNVRMDSEIRELICGHTIGVKGRYLKYTDNDLLTEYEKAIDNLTIDPSNRLRLELGEYKNEQEKEIQELRKELEITQRREQERLQAEKELAEKVNRLYRRIVSPDENEVSLTPKETEKITKEVVRDLKRKRVV